MAKEELEALNDLFRMACLEKENEGHRNECAYNDKKIIKTALKELTEYKKVFEKLNLDISDAVDLENWIRLAQFHYENKNKKLKALEIIKEKEVNVYMLRWYFKHSSYEQYVNDFERNRRDCDLPDLGNKLLTQEEYDLLKEILFNDF